MKTIRLASEVNPFFLEELQLQASLTRKLRINHQGVDMPLFPRRPVKEDPPPTPQLTPREAALQRFEAALQRVKETDAALQLATNEEAAFLADHNCSIDFSPLSDPTGSVDGTYQMPPDLTLTRERLQITKGNALRDFHQALATFAEEKTLYLKEGLVI